MMLTEEEAKTKECPIFSIVAIIACSGVVEEDKEFTKLAVQISKCTGSKCMMWRIIPKTNSGYCGLAGG